MNLNARQYQINIFEKAKLYNTLVVLPTGLGKTLIAILLIENRLKNYPNSKVIFLAPTKPLVMQHKKSIEEHLNKEVIAFTGSTKSEKRKELFEKNSIIVATPQTIQNDLLTKNISLENVSLIVFDEAHRAVKDYPYVYIAQEYHKQAKYERILGLTASPGHDKEKILEICNNLYIEHLEVRTRHDPDVKPYVQEIKIEWIEVELNEELKKIVSMLKEILIEEIERFNKLELEKIGSDTSKKEILRIQQYINERHSTDPRIFEANSSLSLILKLKYMTEVIETQGVTPLYNYILELKKEYFSKGNKTIRRLLSDSRFNLVFSQVKNLLDKNFEHPKLEVLKDIMKKFKESENGKAIIFTNIRDEVEKIKSELEKFGIKCEIFIGQGKRRKKGLTQKEQLNVLEKLKNREIDCIIATSIGEEGLDIPEVDLVIFYEPIPSEIRAIQRKGRTGRQASGKVLMLYTKGTIDEKYHWVSLKREKKMYETLKRIKDILIMKRSESKNNQNLFSYEKRENQENEFSIAKKELKNDLFEENQKKESNQKTLIEDNLNKVSNETIRIIQLSQDKVTIIVDYRERNSSILKELNNLSVDLIVDQLPLGDYLVSSKTAIELKTAEDFIASIIDGRLFDQLKHLKRIYEKPIMIISDYEEIFNKSLHIHSILGALTSIATQLYIPILFARNSQECAKMIYFAALQEQREEKEIHIKKPKGSIYDQLRFTVSSIPGIGYSLSEPLLVKFNTLKNIANASIEELSQVENIGRIRATKIYEFFNTSYKDMERK